MKLSWKTSSNFTSRPGPNHPDGLFVRQRATANVISSAKDSRLSDELSLPVMNIFGQETSILERITWLAELSHAAPTTVSLAT